MAIHNECPSLLITMKEGFNDSVATILGAVQQRPFLSPLPETWERGYFLCDDHVISVHNYLNISAFLCDWKIL